MFRPAPDPALAELLGSSHPVRCQASVWRGSTYFGSAPVVSGELSEASDQFVTGTVSLTVAPFDERGERWTPVQPTDALNVYGSRIHLSYDVGRADGSWLSTSLGWFIIDEWERTRDGIDVSALDLRDSLRTARLLAPSAPSAGGTFVSELTKLVGGRLSLDLTGAPTNRAVSSGMAWSESRTEAIEELLAAWPARAELDGDGSLVVLPDNLDAAPADVTLTGGLGGTVVGQSESGSRDGLFNVVVARGEDSESTATPPVVGYAADQNADSPTWAGGPMGELVTFFASPLLKTKAQADAAAATILRRSLRRSDVIPVTCVPDPRLGVNARVDLALSDGRTARTLVLTSKLPLTADGGAQSLTLGVISYA